MPGETPFSCCSFHDGRRGDIRGGGRRKLFLVFDVRGVSAEPGSKIERKCFFVKKYFHIVCIGAWFGYFLYVGHAKVLVLATFLSCITGM